jgi:hypothetical protein
MYRMAQRNDQVWGIHGYEVPRMNFDHVAHAKHTQNMLVIDGKKKAENKGSINPDAKKEGMLDALIKRSRSTPAPWSYEAKNKISEGQKTLPQIAIPPSKNFQMTKFRWKNIPREQQVIIQAMKRTLEKPDLKTKKNTFIDQIISQNTKENYPIPGPGDYFLDAQSANKYHKSNPSLFTKKDENQTDVKENFP